MANPYLVSGAVLSAAAALLHLGCIFFGPSWYRFFGAGERMAQLSTAGSLVPTLITAGIATVLALWSLYALSGAGVILRLPLVRLALCVIAGVYLLRGLAGLVLAVLAPGDRGVAFWWWSSVICLGIGALYLVGTRQVWSQLSRGAAQQFIQAEPASRVGLIQALGRLGTLGELMDLNAIRTQALSLPEVTEEPHFDYSSFRVRGKIFVTIPPDELHAHFFVADDDRERALAMYSEFTEKLFWGKKVAGLRVALAAADPLVVSDLIRQAWRNKAPRKLVAAGGS